MYDGPIDPENIRAMHRYDPAHSEERTVAGGVVFVGVLLAGLLAMSYPIAAVAFGIVGSFAWSIRWIAQLVDPPAKSFAEWNPPRIVVERSAAFGSDGDER